MKNAGKACNNRLYRHIRTFEKIIKNYFVISVENNGTPIEEEALKHLNNMGKMPLEEITAFVKKKEGGFGISNVVKRLRTYYGEQVSICYIRKEEGTECVIKIEEDGLSHCCA